tara:strand:+ start:32 stop:826 length:795 start_codon:yes stop_codon:yes gene_type:complete
MAGELDTEVTPTGESTNGLAELETSSSSATAPGGETLPDTEVPEGEEKDYKALWEAREAQDAEIEAKNKRDADNNRALKTSLLRQEARDKTQAEILAILKTGQANGEVAEETVAAVEKVQRNAQQAEQLPVSQEKGWATLGAIEENVPEGMDLRTSVELQDVRNRWNKGEQLHRLGLYDLAMEAFDDAEQEMTRWLEKQNTDKRLKTAEADLAEARKDADSNPLDLNVTRPVGSRGNGMSWAQAQKAKNLDAISDDDYAKLIAR